MSEFKTWKTMPLWKQIQKELISVCPALKNRYTCMFVGPNKIYNKPSINLILDPNEINAVKILMQKYNDFVLTTEDWNVIAPSVALDYCYIGTEKPIGVRR